MIGFSPLEAQAYMLSRLDTRSFRGLPATLPSILQSFLLYDLRFMHSTGVLNQEEEQGDADYDDDEAFEYILDAYLTDFPCDEDAAMKVAELLNCYMELQYDYLKSQGLVEE